MKIDVLRDKNDQELQELEDQLREELFRMRLKKHTNQLQQTHRLKETRRSIARIKTILSERRAS